MEVLTTDKIAAPDAEERAVLIEALSRAKSTLHTLRVRKALEAEPAPESSHGIGKYDNLLAFLTRGEPGRNQLRGDALQREIDGAAAQVRVIERMLDAYYAHEDAWQEQNTVKAADPS